MSSAKVAVLRKIANTWKQRRYHLVAEVRAGAAARRRTRIFCLCFRGNCHASGVFSRGQRFAAVGPLRAWSSPSARQLPGLHGSVHVNGERRKAMDATRHTVTHNFVPVNLSLRRRECVSIRGAGTEETTPPYEM